MPPNPEIFKGEGIEIIFKMLQAIYEGRELGMIEKDQMQVQKWVQKNQKTVPICCLSCPNGPFLTQIGIRETT